MISVYLLKIFYYYPTRPKEFIINKDIKFVLQELNRKYILL